MPDFTPDFTNTTKYTPQYPFDSVIFPNKAPLLGEDLNELQKISQIRDMANLGLCLNDGFYPDNPQEDMFKNITVDNSNVTFSYNLKGYMIIGKVAYRADYTSVDDSITVGKKGYIVAHVIGSVIDKDSEIMPLFIGEEYATELDNYLDSNAFNKEVARRSSVNWEIGFKESLSSLNGEYIILADVTGGTSSPIIRRSFSAWLKDRTYDTGAYEHMGVLDCTDAEYTGSTNPDSQSREFGGLVSDTKCLSRLSELYFNNLEDPTLRKTKAHYFVKLNFSLSYGAGSNICELIDDGAGTVLNDGYYSEGHVRIFIIDKNGIRRAFKQEYAGGYDNSGQWLYSWTEWKRICIGADDIADNNIITEKIANKAVTKDKLNDDIFDIVASKDTLMTATAEGQSITLTDQLADEDFIGCRIWGNCGINIFDKSKSLLAAIKNETEFSGYVINMYSIKDTVAMLKPSTKYTVSCDIEITSIPDGTVYDITSSNGTIFGFWLYDPNNKGSVELKDTTVASEMSVGMTLHDVWNITTPADLGAEGTAYRIYASSKTYKKLDGSSGGANLGVIFKNIQFVEGEYTSETMPSYQAYVDVGDLNSKTGKYEIPVAVTGNNLFNRALSLHPSIKNETAIAVTGTTFYQSPAFKKTFRPSTTYTISYDVEIVSLPSSDEYKLGTANRLGFSLYDSVSKYYHDLTFSNSFMQNVLPTKKAGDVIKYTKSFTTPANILDSDKKYGFVEYVPGYTALDGTSPNVMASVIFKNIQVVKGSYTEETMPAFELYTEYKATAQLNSGLGKNEYIDIINKKLYSGGNTANITVDGTIKTIDSISNNIFCQTAVQPESINVDYYQNINKAKVTTEKIADGAITADKLSDDALDAAKSYTDDIFSLAAEKSKAIPHTTAEGQSVKITDQLAGESLLGCKVWGGCGINLFNKNKSLHTAIKNETEYKSYGATIYGASETKAMLKPSTKYTVSCDIEITSVPDAATYNFVDNTTMFGFMVYDSAHPSAGASINVSMAFSDLVVGATSHQVMRFTAPATLGAEGYSFGILGYTKLYQKIEGTGSTSLGVIFKNIQFVEGSYTSLTYQNYTEVGDLNSTTGKYEIPVVSRGINALDKSRANAAGIRNETAVSGFGWGGWKYPTVGAMLKPATQYTVSYDIEVTSVPDYNSYSVDTSNNGQWFGFIFYSKKAPALGVRVLTDTKNVPNDAAVGFKQHIVQTFTTPALLHDSAYSFDLIMYTKRYKKNDENVYVNWEVIFRNMQMVEGAYTSSTMPEYEPYTETVATAQLTKQLAGGEYIDILNKKLYSGDTVTDITVTGELKAADSACNVVIAQTNATPENIEAEYYQDINKVISEVKNAPYQMKYSNAVSNTVTGTSITVSDALSNDAVSNRIPLDISIKGGLKQVLADSSAAKSPSNIATITGVGESGSISLVINPENKDVRSFSIALPSPLYDLSGQKILGQFKSIKTRDIISTNRILRCTHKVILDDSLQWDFLGGTRYSGATEFYSATFDNANTSYPVQNGTCPVVSHVNSYSYGENSNAANENIWLEVTNGGNGRLRMLVKPEFLSITDSDTAADKVTKLKNWLTAQKTAGTPVTMVYVMPKPITEDFRVPKIDINSTAFTVTNNESAEMELKYNRDINSALDEIRNAVLSLGGNV